MHEAVNMINSNCPHCRKAGVTKLSKVFSFGPPKCVYCNQRSVIDFSVARFSALLAVLLTCAYGSLLIGRIPGFGRYWPLMFVVAGVSYAIALVTSPLKQIDSKTPMKKLFLLFVIFAGEMLLFGSLFQVLRQS